MKKVYSFLLASLIGICSFAQTVLSAGDIAFTSYTSDNPDEFAFVLLEDVDSATVISFTDHGWLSTGAFRTNENVIVWTSGQSLAKGTIVTISSTSSSVGSTTGSMPAFSGSGDQVFAFQGTVAMPILLAGLNMDGAWAATASNSNSSALPTALVGFGVAIVPESDNAFYDCVANGFAGSKSTILALLTDSSNWTTSNTLPNTSNCSSFNITVGTSTLTSSVVINSNVSCFGLNDGGATVTASGGTPPYNYSWSNGDTTSIAISLLAGSYTVVVTDSSGFQTSTSVTISEPTALTSSMAVTNATSVGGTDGSISATVSGGTAPYTFTWNNAATTATATALMAGTYTVTITDANSCTITDSATVADPSAVVLVINSTNVSCFGAADGTATVNVSGGTSPYTFSWSPTVTGGTTLTGLLAGTFKLTVTDAVGTIAIDSVSIIEPAQIQLGLAITNTSAIGATDGSIDLIVTGGTPGYTYVWNTGAVTEDLTGLNAAMYTITVTDANGCNATDTAQVLEPGTLANLVITEINYNGPESGTDTSEFIEITNGGLTTVNLNGYTFTQGVTHTFGANDSITAGQYFVIAYDSSAFRNVYGTDADAVWSAGGLSNGGEDIIIVDNFGRGVDTVDFDDSAPWPINSATIGPDGNGSSIELQAGLTSNNNDGANWIASALAVPGVTVNGFQVFGSPGNPNSTSVGVVRDSESELNIYPNPTRGEITIERANNALERIQIISIDGKVLNEVQIAQNKITLDLLSYSNGIYFLKIGTEIKKVLIAK